MRKSSGALAKCAQPFRLECTHSTLGEFVRHRVHSLAQRLELRSTTHGAPLRKRFSVCDAFRPANELVERPAQLAAEMSCDSRHDERDDREAKQREHDQQRTRSVDNELESSCLS